MVVNNLDSCAASKAPVAGHTRGADGLQKGAREVGQHDLPKAVRRRGLKQSMEPAASTDSSRRAFHYEEITSRSGHVYLRRGPAPRPANRLDRTRFAFRGRARNQRFKAKPRHTGVSTSSSHQRRQTPPQKTGRKKKRERWRWRGGVRKREDVATVPQMRSSGAAGSKMVGKNGRLPLMDRSGAPGTEGDSCVVWSNPQQAAVAERPCVKL